MIPPGQKIFWSRRHRLGLVLGWLVAAVCLLVPSTRSEETPRTSGRGQAEAAAANTLEPVSPLGTLGTTLRDQHLTCLHVDRWQAEGFRGQGLKVAILDTGFHDYHKFLGRELPEHVTAKSFRSDGDLEGRKSEHGIFCAEVIHTLAPDAELLFANWDPDNPDGFLKAARWARRQGAQVITCSVIEPSWSDGEGGGAIHEALADIVGPGTQPGDLLFFACAGNTAQRTWSGRFSDGGDGYHEWQPGQTVNLLTPWIHGDPVAVELYGQPGADYELSVCDRQTGHEVERSRARESEGRGSALVHFLPEARHTYQVRVRLLGGTAGRFHLVALGARLEYATARGSIPFPADGTRIVAVGAVTQDGRRLSYSSCGPNSLSPKPDLVAPVPFPSLWHSKPFSGTSAAAPQAAALAALCWSRHPTWTAEQIRTTLQKAARDLGPPGFDCETGYGMICLP